MQSLTFDMIGMTLMAIITGITTFGMATWVYLKETAGSAAPLSARQGADDDPAAPTTGGFSPSVDHARPAASTAAEARQDQRVLVGHR